MLRGPTLLLFAMLPFACARFVAPNAGDGGGGGQEASMPLDVGEDPARDISQVGSDGPTVDGTEDGNASDVLGPDLAPCGGSCSAGLDCVDGSCRCIEGGSCGGCCADASTCIAVPTIEQCGNEGSTCFACSGITANRCIDVDSGHCACSAGTYPGPGLPPECEAGMRCDTSSVPPVCVPE